MHAPPNSELRAPLPAAIVEPGAQALVSRQPIYGPAMTVAAYELLYAQASDPDLPGANSEATLRALADGALEIGLDRLAGALPVYINYPAELLAEANPLSVQPQRVVIQVTADSLLTETTLTGLASLKQRGHLVALTGYDPHEHEAQLLKLADIVKTRLDTLEPAQMARLVMLLKQRGLQVIATDVATVEQFDQAGEMGFDGFQGTFLSRPERLESSRAPRNGLATMRLVAKLQDPACTFEEVEALMRQDLSMSYRALRCINSSYYSLPQRVDSIRQALVLLGMENLRQLCSLAALQQLDGRPPSVLVMAMARARMCEQLAKLGGQSPTAPYFITGLFSMLDVLMSTPMARIVEELPLAPAVKDALVAGEGDMGQALHCARAYESGLFHAAHYRTVATQLVRAAYLDAVHGAEQALAST